jgi:iron complex outermembrane receptor protein
MKIFKVLLSCCLVVCLGNPLFAAQQEDVKADETVDMEEMVVTATRTEREIDNVPASVSVITREEMKKYHIQTIDEALKYEAGIYFKRKKGLSDSLPSIEMRGLPGQERTLVLLNGLPINGGYDGGVKWNNISVENIERIEIIRGPASALYGGNAMGGVINIITTTPQKLEAEIFGGIGSDETYRYGGYVGDKFDKFGIRFGYEAEETGGYPTSLVTRSIYSGTGTLTGGYPTTSTSGTPKWVVGDKGDNWAKRQNINLMASYDLTETGTISLDFQYGQHKYGYDEPNTYLTDASGEPSFSGTVDVGDGQYASVKPYNYIYYTGIGNEDSYLASLTYKETFGSVGFTGKIGYQFNNKWYTTTTDTTGTFDNATGKLSDADTETWLADLQANMPLGDKHFLTCGLYFKTDSFEQDSYNLSYYRDEDSKLDKIDITRGKDLFYALYVQDEWRVLEQLTLYGGLRFDFWKAYDGKSGSVGSVEEYDEPQDYAISPKIGAVWNPLEDTYLRGSVAKGFRAPNIYELYRTWQSGWYTYHSNPDLDPEIIWTYEVGADQYLFNRKLKIGATFFHSRLKDAIERYKVGTDKYLDNVAKVEINGWELEGQLLPFDWLKIWANYTNNDSEVKENERNPDAEGKHLPYMPLETINLGSELTYKWFKLSLAGDYLGRIYTTEDNNDVPDVYGGYSKRWLWNTKLTFTPEENVEFSLSVDNIFDEDYFEYYKGRGRSYFFEIRLKY